MSVVEAHGERRGVRQPLLLSVVGRVLRELLPRSRRHLGSRGRLEADGERRRALHAEPGIAPRRVELDVVDLEFVMPAATGCRGNAQPARRAEIDRRGASVRGLQACERNRDLRPLPAGLDRRHVVEAGQGSSPKPQLKRAVAPNAQSDPFEIGHVRRLRAAVESDPCAREAARRDVPRNPQRMPRARARRRHPQLGDRGSANQFVRNRDPAQSGPCPPVAVLEIVHGAGRGPRHEGRDRGPEDQGIEIQHVPPLSLASF